MDLAVIFVFIVLPIVEAASLTTAPAGQEINKILNIFRTCYTDLIFSVTVFDILEPDYPILISTITAQNHPLVTPSTFRESENLTLSPESGSLPIFNSPNGTSPQPIRVRFSCVSMVLIGGPPRDIQFGHYLLYKIKYRHKWIHTTYYDSDETLYSDNVYINLVSFQSVAMESLNPPPIEFPILQYNSFEIWRALALYFWVIPYQYQIHMELGLTIFLNPPCSYPIFFGKVTSSNLNLKTLDGIFNIGIQNECLLAFHLELTDINVHDGIINYCGTPTLHTTLIYPKDRMGKLLHKSALFFSLLSRFVNCTILSVAVGVHPLTTDCGKRWFGSNKYLSLSDEQATDHMSSSIGQFFPTRTMEFEFLTCDRSGDFVDFGAFVKPFDLEVWLSLVILVFVSTEFLWIILRLKGQTENVFLLLCSALVKHGYHIRESVHKLRSFNVFLTVFLFMTIVLSNGYKGIVITHNCTA